MRQLRKRELELESRGRWAAMLPMFQGRPTLAATPHLTTDTIGVHNMQTTPASRPRPRPPRQPLQSS
eukprot:scaffold14685_cov154-Isochrysis_galbana.AAC.1